MFDPKSEPVRIAYIVLGAAIAILAVLGVTDGAAVDVIGQILVLIGGGEALRQKVTPERNAKQREADAFDRGRQRR